MKECLEAKEQTDFLGMVAGATGCIIVVLARTLWPFEFYSDLTEYDSGRKPYWDFELSPISARFLLVAAGVWLVLAMMVMWYSGSYRWWAAVVWLLGHIVESIFIQCRVEAIRDSEDSGLPYESGF